MVLGLFAKQETITAGDVPKLLGLSDRQVRDLIRGWVMDAWRRGPGEALPGLRVIGGISALNRWINGGD